MNPKALIPLVAGLGIAGLAAKLGFDHLRSAQGAATKTIQLWTPTQDIPRGTAITEQMVRPLAFPAELAPKSAIVKLEQLIGRVPHTGAPAGVPILESMLLPPGTQPGIYVPPGLRAVAVKIDESSGVDNHLEPGCRVDVVGYFNTRRADRTEIVARTLIENCEVAAVGARLAPEPPTRGDAAPKGKTTARERPARAVTLLVKPEQVPTLHLAEQRGKIKLSMRAYDGQATPEEGSGLAEATEAQLLGEGEPAENEPRTSSGGSLADLVGGLLGSLLHKAPAQPAASAEPPPPAAAASPPLAWTMVIYNGDDRQVLGWESLSSMKAFEMSGEGPNIFQPQAPGRGTPLPPAQTPPLSEPTPPAQRDSSGEQTHEPQELFE